MSKNELFEGAVTLGFSAALGIAVCIYLFLVYALIIVAIILVVLLIKYFITAARHKKIAPLLDEIDNCDNDEVFADLISDSMTLAFKNGFVLKSNYYEGEKNVSFYFIKSDKPVVYGEVIDCLCGSNADYKAIVTNSHLDKNALFCCKNRDIFVVDRDVLIEILLFNLKSHESVKKHR